MLGGREVVARRVFEGSVVARAASRPGVASADAVDGVCKKEMQAEARVRAPIAAATECVREVVMARTLEGAPNGPETAG